MTENHKLRRRLILLTGVIFLASALLILLFLYSDLWAKLYLPLISSTSWSNTRGFWSSSSFSWLRCSPEITFACFWD